jgi:histidyl-tRNA synthetase
MAGRNHIFNTIRSVYEKFGFQQIETPSMEMLSTLEGKYGEEGDKLLFRILNSGAIIDDFPVMKETIQDFVDRRMVQYSSKEFPAAEIIRPRDLQKHITEKGLRYDLTVPFARYVVMHQNEITFPFKRYQIQPVWRADRPQKGRYREFYQCDADVIGTSSLLNEMEFIQIIDEVFTALGIAVTIKVSNRKLLYGLIESMEATQHFHSIVIIIDKIDKIGEEKVLEELKVLGLNAKQLAKMKDAFNAKNNDQEINLGILDELVIGSETGKAGADEVKQVLRHFGAFDWIKPDASHHFFKINNHLQLDLSLARGLNYYTGMIFEVKINDARSSFTSSVLGGGRYDDLTGIFGMPGVSGVGISFGVDRIYDVMEECGLLNDAAAVKSSTQILFVNFGGEEERVSINYLQQIRAAGIAAEIYSDHAKMKKQMTYADNKKIPFVAIIGSEELQKNLLTVKNMKSGEQSSMSIDALISLSKSE